MGWKKNDVRDDVQEGNPQSKAKAVAESAAQAQKGEMEAWREGGIKTHEESLFEVGQPYFVASKWEEESGGACVEKEGYGCPRPKGETVVGGGLECDKIAEEK